MDNLAEDLLQLEDTFDPENPMDLLKLLGERMETHKSAFYAPYPKQQDFHNAVDPYGLRAWIKALMAGNQIGKTKCAAEEISMHATGDYPDWYEGTRFDHPVQIQCGSSTNETARDIIQNELLGPPEDESMWGTGTLPMNALGKISKKAGVTDGVDTIQVKHKTGGWSSIKLRAYEQGKQKHMGKRFHVGWCDEEPPQDIWSQYLRGILSMKGILLLTFTPESGITQLVADFMQVKKKGRSLTTATWADAPHLMADPEKLREVKDQFPEHEWEMREKGIPMMGSGLVWPVPDEDITFDLTSFPEGIPRHWPRICGIDFGYDHPFAAAWLAWDRDTDTVYVYDLYKERKKTPVIHSSAVNKRGKWRPVVWPHDGLNTEKSSAKPLADSYRKEGVNMMYKKFSNPPGPGEEEGEGGNSVEYGVIDILERMQDGRFKVARHLKDFWDEKGVYHRKDGKIVKFMDDVVSAVRYACLSLRFARTRPMHVKPKNLSRGARNVRNRVRSR